MKPSHLIVILFLGFSLGQAGWAHAEIYKRVDADGHVTYSSEPIKGSKKLYLKPLPTMSGSRASKRSTPEDFPKVDSQTQQRRDNTRRLILEDELASEENFLTQAREKLKALESETIPQVGRDGIPFRDVQVHEGKLTAVRAEITLHEQNIQALRTEISNLK